MTTSPSTAAEYADRLAERIADAAATEAPFGYVNTQTDETADADDLAQALNLTERELDDMLTTAGRFELDNDGLATDWPEDQEEPPTRADIMGDWEEAGGYDYLRDVLDIRYVIASDRTYRDAEICIGLGGPNVWIHTATKTVEVWWAFEHASRPLPSSYVDALDEAAQEAWEMGA